MDLTNVKAKDLIMMDARKEGVSEKMLELLYKMPFFKDSVDITTDMLEIAIRKMQKKYPVRLAYISTITPADPEEEPETYYSFMVKRTDNHVHIKTVYGITLFDGLARVAILMFGFIKSMQKGGSS